jgi:mRNA-degrading endonuclease toxin of MazEF toxin-antitoxin module
MVINQRDVYLLPHPINPASQDYHPFIVLSDQRANKYEKTFIAVMITSSAYKRDHYSFPLTDEMFEDNLQKDDCHARMHLITLWIDEEIRGKKLNVMKEVYFNQLMKSIGDLIFNYNFSPITKEIE